METQCIYLVNMNQSTQDDTLPATAALDIAVADNRRELIVLV